MFANHQPGVFLVVLIIARPFSDADKSQSFVEVLGPFIADPYLQRRVGRAEIGQVLQQCLCQQLADTPPPVFIRNGNIGDMALVQ